MIALIVLTCGLFLGGGVDADIASHDELQPGPFEKPVDEVIS